MKSTQYFEEQVLRKRPYIDRSQCAEVVAHPLARLVQDVGRIRHWGGWLMSGTERYGR